MNPDPRRSGPDDPDEEVPTSFDFFADTAQQPRPLPPDVEPRHVQDPQPAAPPARRPAGDGAHRRRRGSGVPARNDLNAFPSTHSLPNLFGSSGSRPGRAGPPPQGPPRQSPDAAPAAFPDAATATSPLVPPPPTAPLPGRRPDAVPEAGRGPAPGPVPGPGPRETAADPWGAFERRPPVQPPAPVARPGEQPDPSGARRAHRLTHRLATWQETLRGGRRPVPRQGRPAVARHHVPGGGNRTDDVPAPDRDLRRVLAAGTVLVLGILVTAALALRML